MEKEPFGIELIARGLCIQDNQVLLCRNVKHGYTFLPGGHVEFGETAREALGREFLEETGLSAQIGSLAHVQEHIFRQSGRLRHEVNLMFHVELITGPVVSREFKIAFDWIPIASLSQLDLRPASHALLICGPGTSTVWSSEVVS